MAPITQRIHSEKRNLRLEAHLMKRPFVLNIETTSVCNAKCCFCPYTTMSREREQMTMDLFEKIVSEYDAMGGGALLLTPIVGEFFLDKKCLERIEVVRRYKNIGMISVTSNGIALDKLGDSGREYFLRNANFLQVSLGGLSRDEYFEMYKVDRFDRVLTNIIEFAKARNRVNPSFPLRLAMRVSRPLEALMKEPLILQLQDLGWEISGDNTFANWGGQIVDSDLPNGAVLRHNPHYSKKVNPCFVFYLGLYVSSSGLVTACGCMDSEIVLEVGDCRKQTLSEIWQNETWKHLRDSFGTEDIPDICKKCSLYEDGEVYSTREAALNYEEGRFPFGY